MTVSNRLSTIPVARRGMLGGLAALPLVPAVARAASPPPVSIFQFIPDSARAGIAAGTSGFDCGPAIATALASVPAVYLPAGKYAIATPIRFAPRIAGRFGAGPMLVGDGDLRTVLDARGLGAPVLEFDSGATAADFRAISGVDLSGFAITGRASAGIRMRGCYTSRIADLRIAGPDTGIAFPCRLGDNDGSNMVALERVRIENCPGWGIDAAADPGHNEISFLSLRQVFVQNCGTAGVGEPATGGMRWKGQVLDIEQCAFTLNHNAGLFIPGQAGLALNARVVSTDFENNLGRGILCTGVSVFVGENLQFFNNDAFPTPVACEFRGDRFTVRGVQIDGVSIRATAGNRPYTAFRMTGANLEIANSAIRNVIWENFGHPGQLRSEGLIPL